MTDPTSTPPLTPRQDAAVRPLETPAGADVGTETPEGATGPQADTQGREPESGCAHCGGLHAWNDCQEYADLVSTESVKCGPVIPVADHVAEDQAAWQRYAAARDREAASQVDRWSRREQLGVLLSRMQRGVLLDAERPLLRAAVEVEVADAEQAHAQLAQQRADFATLSDETDRLARLLDESRVDHREERGVRRWQEDEATRLRDERDRARRVAVELEQQVAAVAALHRMRRDRRR